MWKSPKVEANKSEQEHYVEPWMAMECSQNILRITSPSFPHPSLLAFLFINFKLVKSFTLYLQRTTLLRAQNRTRKKFFSLRDAFIRKNVFVPCPLSKAEAEEKTERNESEILSRQSGWSWKCCELWSPWIIQLRPTTSCRTLPSTKVRHCCAAWNSKRSWFIMLM